ncbi:MAG: hypothetical protein H6555_03075 [Lewinellaceae bacterium]|nr:hypothetical protein [Lewinellaceae bacterium]
MKNSPPVLRPGIDFYLENGRYVFTALFLRERGFCCNSGCRHCPYPKEDNTVSAEHTVIPRQDAPRETPIQQPKSANA